MVAAVEVTVTVSTEFQASNYQQAIFDFITDGAGDGLVNAVAGSGKTTTLVQAARLLKTDRAAFFAFNKHISEELNARLAGTPMRASTIHSFGFRMLGNRFGRMTVKEDKYRAEAEKYIDANLTWDQRGVLAGHAGDEAREKLKDQLDARRDGLVKLVDFARMSLTRPDDAAGLRALIAQYQIDLPSAEDEEFVVRGARPIIERGADMIRRLRVVDFTDMVWGPVFLAVPVEKFDWVFTDECQDLNTAQRRLMLATRAPGGRMLFVGDVNQAIMNFAGADARSFWAIQEETGATLLPLSVCYRCPASHLDLARRLVPQIEARPNAPEGTILAIHEEKILENVREGMMILCRTTSHLVSLCIRLIRHRIPARVRGRDVAKGLIDMARKVGKRVPFDQFPAALAAYKAAQIERLAESPNSEARVVALQDKVAALQACYEEFGAKTLADLCTEIDGIFHDGRASVVLSTVHRAKGLDTDDVMILHPELLPFEHPKQTPEQKAQERNIYYVALTRAKQSLIFAYPDGETLPETALGNLNLD